MRPHAACAVLVALLIVRSAGATGDVLNDVMRALAARRHGEAEFVEQQFLHLMKRPLESSGRLTYDAPDRLEKRTLQPRAESLRVSGSIVTLERAHHVRVFDLSTYPQVAPFVLGLRATLAGDRDALQKEFKVDISGDLSRWVLVLTPLDPQAAEAVARISIEGSGNELRNVEYRSADGGRSRLTLRPMTSSP